MTIQKMEESVSEAMNATVTTLNATLSNVNSMSCKISEHLSATCSITNSRINHEQSSMVKWQDDLKKDLANLHEDLMSTSVNMEGLSKSVGDVLIRACTSSNAYMNEIEMVSWLVPRFPPLYLAVACKMRHSAHRPLLGRCCISRSYQELKNIEDWAKEQLSLQRANLGQQKEDIMAYVAQRQAATDRHIDSVVAEVNKLMTGFKDSTKLDWERRSSNITSDFEKSITAFDDFGVKIANHIEESNNIAQARVADINTSLETARHEHSGRFGALRDAILTHGHSVGSVTCKLACNTEKTKTELDAIAAKLDSNVTEIAQSTQQFPKAVNKCQANMDAVMETMNCTITKSLKVVIAAFEPTHVTADTTVICTPFLKL